MNHFILWVSGAKPNFKYLKEDWNAKLSEIAFNSYIWKRFSKTRAELKFSKFYEAYAKPST